MATKPVIEIVEKDEEHIIYYMYQDLMGLNLYERTKAIERFINNATKTLEIAISNDVREILRKNGIIPQDGSENALTRAFDKLEDKGYAIAIIDRYYQIEDERIIGESFNEMTIILEGENLISCSIEIRLEQKGKSYEYLQTL